MLDVSRLLLELRAEKARVECAIETLTQLQRASDASATSEASVALRKSLVRRGRPSMSPEERHEVSRRMQTYLSSRPSRKQP